MNYNELVKNLRQCAEGSCAGGKNDLVEIGCRGMLQNEAADAIENVSKAYQMMAEAYEAEVTNPRWIPVTERCPEKSGDYLVFDDCRNLYVNEWHCLLKKWQYDDSRITHWQPLPEPPKEETE